MESESDDSVSENEGALVEAASISHVGSSSCSSSTFNIERQSIPIEYDIGKLQDSGVDIKRVAREFNTHLHMQRVHALTRKCNTRAHIKGGWPGQGNSAKMAVTFKLHKLASTAVSAHSVLDTKNTHMGYYG